MNYVHLQIGNDDDSHRIYCDAVETILDPPEVRAERRSLEVLEVTRNCSYSTTPRAENM